MSLNTLELSIDEIERNRLAVSFETPEIARLTLANPPVNSIEDRMAEMLTGVFRRIHEDTTVRVLVIGATGPHFCAGADLKEKSVNGPGTGEHFWRMIHALETLRCPSIAAIHGSCAGGGLDLALSCDLRIAASGARFICAGVNVGLTASAAKLTRLVGLSRAKAVLLTGLPFDAEHALRMGLVAEVVADDELQGAADRLARRIASRAPLAVEATKRLADGANSMTPAEAAELQIVEGQRLRKSLDHATGIDAALNKTDPVFKRH